MQQFSRRANKSAAVAADLEELKEDVARIQD